MITTIAPGQKVISLIPGMEVIQPRGGAFQLKNDLISWWSMDEATGAQRNDSHDGNNLTDVNAVTRVAGRVNFAAHMASLADQFLGVGDNPSLSTGDIDFTVAFWVWFDLVPIWETGIVGKAGAIAANRYEWIVYFHPLSTIIVRISDGVAFGTVGTFVSVLLNTWYYIVMWYDSVGNTINVQLDDGVPSVNGWANGSWDSPEGFFVGRWGGRRFDGRVDELAFWKRLLTADERTWLWNGGAGRAYTDL